MPPTFTSLLVSSSREIASARLHRLEDHGPGLASCEGPLFFSFTQWRDSRLCIVKESLRRLGRTPRFDDLEELFTDLLEILSSSARLIFDRL